MSIPQKAPRKVTVTPADPKYTERDIRKQHLRVAPYCRVSTGSEEQETSFTAQMEYFTQRIADNEDWTMVKMYADRGITGTSAKKRPEFLKMIRDAEKGRIDLVITKSVSRFCRNTLDGLDYVRRLKRCGVGVYFEKENTNTLYMDKASTAGNMYSAACWCAPSAEARTAGCCGCRAGNDGTSGGASTGWSMAGVYADTPPPWRNRSFTPPSPPP